MGEREEQIDDLALAHHVERLAHVEHRAVVVVREDAALGRTGGSRRVDEGERVLGLDRGAAPRQHRLVAYASTRADILERDPVGHVALGVDHDDRAELGEAIADRDDLRHLARILGDHGHGLGVARDPLAFLRRVRRVDGHDDGAGAGDREVRVGPLGPGVGEDADALTRLDAEVHEPERDLAHDLADLRVRHLVPFAVTLVLHRNLVGVLARGKAHQVGNGLRAGRRLVGRDGGGLHLLPSGWTTSRRGGV